MSNSRFLQILKYNILDMSKEKGSFFRDWLWKLNGVETDPEVEEFIQEIKDKEGVYEYEKEKWKGTLTFLCVISADLENGKREIFLAKKGGNPNQLDIVLARDLLNWIKAKGEVPEFQELRNDTRIYPGEWTNELFSSAINEGIGVIRIPRSMDSIKLNFASSNF